MRAISFEEVGYTIEVKKKWTLLRPWNNNFYTLWGYRYEIAI